MARGTHLLGLLGLLALLAVGFGLKAEHFLSAVTLKTIVNQIPDALLLAVAMTFVLLIGGIDLSVGAVMGLSGAVLGTALAVWGWPLPAAILAALACGAACGLINGAVSVKARIPSFIVTLGMLEAARGATYLLTDSRTRYVGGAVERLAEPGLLGLSPALWAALLAAVGAAVVLSRTVFGRSLYAVGGSPEAAHLAGVPTQRLQIGVFALSGLLAGLASAASVARLGSSDPNAGTGAELQAIAAAVIGGTSLLGGRGGVEGSVLGVLILAVLGNGLVQVGAEEPHKRLITGVVIVVAVLADVLRARMAARR